MRIWLDMANSPHPVLFEPVADELERRGHEVVVTTRDHAQTLALTRTRWPQAELVGAASPPSRAGKARTIAARAFELARFARRVRPDVAVSHNSYAQALGARLAGVPVVTAMDYEFQPANHVAFRAAHRVLVPDAFPEDALRSQGARRKAVRRYRGFKEEAYLKAFEPDPSVPSSLGLAPGSYVVARPAMTGASYHRHGNPLFAEVLRALVRDTDVTVVLLTRGAADLEELPSERIVVPEQPVEARSLIAGSRALVGAGGTMNREAALLGVPVFSLFAGRLGALDSLLLADGRMRHLSSPGPELDALVAAAAAGGAPVRERPRLEAHVLDRFVEAAEELGSRSDGVGRHE